MFRGGGIRAAILLLLIVGVTLFAAGCGGSRSPDAAVVSKLAAHTRAVDAAAVKLKREADLLARADERRGGARSHHPERFSGRERRALSAAAKAVAHRPSAGKVAACVRRGRSKLLKEKNGGSASRIAGLVRRCLGVA